MTAPVHYLRDPYSITLALYRQFLASFHSREFQLLNLSRTTAGVSNRDVSRAIFAAMLRKAFAGDSDNERAERAGPVLGICPRHVRRLLNCEHDAKVNVVLAVIVIIGFEAAVSIINKRGRG